MKREESIEESDEEREEEKGAFNPSQSLLIQTRNAYYVYSNGHNTGTIATAAVKSYLLNFLSFIDRYCGDKNGNFNRYCENS